MNKARTWTQVVIAVAVVMLLVVVAGRQQKRSETPREEPHVTVVVDEESGKTESMPLERYIMGVVGGEMGRLPSAEGDGKSEDWPEQAYAAQAILARTFILTWLEENPDKPISSDVTEAQAYNADNVTDIIRKAVESTRGEVIYYKDKLARTFFHSYAGGETADAQEGLNFKDGELPYIQNVKLPKNEYAPDDVEQWTVSIPLADIQEKLQESDVRVGTIEDITIDDVGPSGRITKVTIRGASGKHTMHGADFRLLVGPDKLKSMRIEKKDWKVEDGKLNAKGTGFGHGVGLSQWDAYKMAKEKKTPEDIVKAFFKDIKIVKLWK